VAGRAGIIGAVVLALLGAARATADLEDLEPQDIVNLVSLEDRLLAVNPATGAVAEVDLELGERLIEMRSRGLVGVALTSRRLLGITSRSAVWAELRYRVTEGDGAFPLHLSDRVALVELPHRLAALAPGSGGWQELSVGPSEQLVRIDSSARIITIVTSRRAIGYSRRSGFVEVSLSPREQVERASLDDRSAALITSHRVLIFQAGGRGWSWLRD
jgi:hypothetical protein